jgi:preprotein translocase subunit SecG
MVKVRHCLPGLDHSIFVVPVVFYHQPRDDEQFAASSLGQTLQQIKMQEFLNRMYTFLAGIAWLIIMIVTENYFRHGAEKSDLARRTTRFIGVELALIFIADLILAIMIGLDILSLNRWILLIVEMVGAVGLIWLGFIKFKKVPRRFSQIG